MVEIDSHGINEQLHFPDMGMRDDHWYEVALSGGVVAVRSDFESLEDTILDALEAENHQGRTFGEILELKLVPGELNSEAITCLHGMRASLLDAHTRENERVIFIANRVERLPHNVLRDFSIGPSQEPRKKFFRIPDTAPDPTFFDAIARNPSTKAT